jgi:hypothetical protein
VVSTIAEDKLRLVGYCGLYCGLCAQRNRIPLQAKVLRDSLRKEGYASWYKHVESMKDTFPVFWEFLDNLMNSDCSCRGGGGPPDCKMRTCAVQRVVDACPFCEDYPCDHINNLGEHYVTMIQDGLRLRKIGLEAWVVEQEERAKRGVVYADTRIP